MNQRLFVAVDLPDEVRDELERLCVGIPGARWNDPEQYHLTLRFIGEVDGLIADDIEQGLAEVEFEPFELELQGFGHFPPRGQPKVLWAGVSPHDTIEPLRRAVVRVVNGAGVAPESRKYSPHVTVARFPYGAPIERLQRFFAGHALYRSRPFVVESFHLYSSQLHPEGAIHRLEASYGPGDDEDLNWLRGS